jgi:iron complex outermembrane receptor protein
MAVALLASVFAVGAFAADEDENKKEDEAIDMPEVVVAGSKLDGSAEAGYRVKEAMDVGPWGDRSLQDTPYSRTVISSDMIENSVALDATQLMKMNPLTQVTIPSRVLDGALQVNIRGFGNVVSYDGVPTVMASNGSNAPLEDMERVEIHAGPSNFLYNTLGMVGGVVNFVSKRPTERRQMNFTVGNYGGTQYYLNADLGGPIDAAGKFRYRFNLAGQNGETSIQGNYLKRLLISGAVDWAPSDNLVIGFHARRYIYDQEGAPPYWNSAQTGYDGWKPDNGKTYTPRWVGSHTTTDQWGVRAKWDINSIFSLRGNYIDDVRKWDDGNVLYRSYINSRDDMSMFLLFYAPNQYKDRGGSVYLDAKFNTGPVAHTFVVGYSGNQYRNYTFPNQVSVGGSPEGCSFENCYIPKPDFARPWAEQERFNSGRYSRRGFKFGDDIRFSEQWSLMVGGSYSQILQKNMNAAGDVTDHYDDSRLTPTVSLLYKPKPWLTTYGTYIEALEQGTIVSAEYNNEGEIFAPYVSWQYEFGAKADVYGMLLTAAWFNINKVNTYRDESTMPRPTLSRDGRQIHRGLELTATGKLIDRITLTGGLTLMDPYVDKTDNPAIKGKRPGGVAARMLKMYGEYQVPSVRGFYLTGGGYFTGNQYQNNINTVEIPRYTVFDVGARYVAYVADRETTFRLNIMNVGDKNYWSNSFALGEPRTIAFSVSTGF